MTKARQHYIGDEILDALRKIDEESDDWHLRGRHPENVDFTVHYDGGNYLHVKIDNDDSGFDDD